MTLELALALGLEAGLYECAHDHNICDQEVRVFKTGDNLTAIKVEYRGWCGSMGPYLYPCHGNVCEDTNARFTIHDNQSFHWENLGHSYECEMTAISSAALSE